MIIFDKIEIENFQSISRLSFDFKPGLFLVSGLNGSGKSSIFEAIIWVITGKSERDTNVSTNDKGGCVCSLYFTNGNSNCKITRYNKHSVYKNNVFFEINGVQIESNVEDTISREINISYELLTFVYFVMQGVPISFSSFKPTARKMMLEDLFSSVSFSSTKELFDLKYKKACEEQSVISREQIYVNTKLSSLEIERSGIQNSINQNLNSSGFDPDSNRLRLKELTDKYSNLVADISDIDINYYRDKISRMSSSVMTISREISNHNEIINTGECVLCKSPYPKDKINESINTIREKTDVYNNLNKMLSEYNNTVTEYNSKHKVLSDLNNEIGYIRSRLDGYESSLAANSEMYSKMLDDIDAKRSQLLDQAEKLSISIKNATHRVDGFRFLSELFLPSSKFRTKILMDKVLEIEKAINQICDETFTGFRIALKPSAGDKGIDLKVYRGNKSSKYSSFSIGERRLLDVIFIQAFRRYIIRAIGIDMNITVFDEIFDGLDSENVEVVLASLNEMYSGDFSTYIISHRKELKSKFDNVIEVKANNGFTRVGVV